MEGFKDQFEVPEHILRTTCPLILFPPGAKRRRQVHTRRRRFWPEVRATVEELFLTRHLQTPEILTGQQIAPLCRKYTRELTFDKIQGWGGGRLGGTGGGMGTLGAPAMPRRPRLLTRLLTRLLFLSLTSLLFLSPQPPRQSPLCPLLRQMLLAA